MRPLTTTPLYHVRIILYSTRIPASLPGSEYRIKFRQHVLYLVVQIRTQLLLLIYLLHYIRMFAIHKVQEFLLIILDIVDRIFIHESPDTGVQNHHFLGQRHRLILGLLQDFDKPAPPV